MAFQKNPKTTPDPKIPTGEKGKQYIEELRNIKSDLEELKRLTEQVKSSKLMPPDAMNKINATIDNLKKDVRKLNNDFPELGFDLGK